MKIGILSTLGTANAVLDHAEETILGVQPNVTDYFVEDSLLEIKPEFKYINTCVGIQNFILNKKAREAVLGLLDIKPAQPSSTIYGMFNGENFSDFMEISFSNKFMTGEIGPNVGFSLGTGIKIQENIEDVFPQIVKIKNFLRDIKYRGEVLCGITKNFKISSISFGHFYGHFGMFMEVLKTGTCKNALEFILGTRNTCELYDNLVIGNVVSVQPYPLTLPNSNIRIMAPQSAEKHLWRIKNLTLEFVLITIHGNSLQETKRRMRRTLENMTNYEPNLQYRIDYGRTPHFVLVEEQFQKFAERVYEVPKQNPEPETKETSEVSNTLVV